MEIFEAEHAVRVEYPSDDLLVDFLTDDVEDEYDIPDTIHDSNSNSTYSVGFATETCEASMEVTSSTIHSPSFEHSLQRSD